MKWLQEWPPLGGLDVRVEGDTCRLAWLKTPPGGRTLIRCLRIEKEGRIPAGRNLHWILSSGYCLFISTSLCSPLCPPLVHVTSSPHLDTAKASPAELPPPCLIVHKSSKKFNRQKLQTYQKGEGTMQEPQDSNHFYSIDNNISLYLLQFCLLWNYKNIISAKFLPYPLTLPPSIHVKAL